MRQFRIFLAMSLAAMLVAEAAPVEAAATHLQTIAASAARAGADLNKLLRDYREAEFKLRPNEAIARGDERYLDRYDESLTQAYLNGRRRVSEDTRNKLAAIDPSSLNTQDALSYEIFRWALEDEA